MGRVLLLQHDSVFERYGGVQYFLHDLCTLSSEILGFENFHTLVPKRSESPRVETASYSKEFVPYPKAGVLATLANRVPWNLYRTAHKRIATLQPDLILCSHVSLAPLGFALSQRTAVPYSVIVYGTDCWGDLWPQDEWSLRRAATILSISEWTKSILRRRGYDSARIEVVHPRIFEDFEKDRVPRPEKVDSAMRLLCVSRLDAAERYKGQDDTLRALQRVRQRAPQLAFSYTIVGDGEDNQRLSELAETLGLSDVVQFKPAVQSREALAELYAQSDLYVMPSRFGRWDGEWRGEGFGIVYAEAAAFGVPSVAYRCGGVMDIVQDRNTGWLLPPDSVTALSKCLERLLSQPDHVREIGEKARTHCLARFSREAVRNELQSAFKRMLVRRAELALSSPLTSN